MPGGGTPVETDKDYGPQDDPRSLVRKYTAELDFAKQAFTRFHDRAEQVDRRYKDERTDTSMGAPKRFNALWANFRLSFPAHWSRIPEPVVAQLFDNDSPVVRVASLVLERALRASMHDDDRFGQAMAGVVQDRLLDSRGTAWVRYVPHMRTITPDPVEVQPSEWSEDDNGQPTRFGMPDGSNIGADNVELSDDQRWLYNPPSYDEVAFDEVVPDYVNWRDYMHTPSRRWAEVWWVARRVHMTKDEVASRFDNAAVLARMQREPIAKRIPYNYDAAKEIGRKSDTAGGSDPYKKAEIWELWDIHARKAVWLCKEFGESVLDILPDPLKLKNFFPSPRPAWGTIGTDSLEPVPDYYEYQDQAVQLDELTDRISLLAQAVSVSGAYNAEFPVLKDLLGGARENKLVAVDNWALFAERGGVPGLISWVPIDMIVTALEKLVAQRQVIKADLWEISGWSDIMRGATDPDETYGAQQLKSKYGTLGLTSSQLDIQRFARDLIRLMAEVMCLHLQPDTLMLMSGFDLMTQDDPEQAQYFDAAVQLLRDNRMRSWRIDIETDSTIALDEESERNGLAGYLKAMGEALPAMMQLVQQAPEFLEWAGESLKHMARKFRAGRQVEGALDRALKALSDRAQNPQPQPPDPKLISAQASAKRADTEATRVETENTNQTKNTQIKEFTAVAKAKNDEAEAAHDMAATAYDLQHARPGPGSAPLPPIPPMM